MVEKSSFIKVHDLSRRFPTKQVSAQLEHIIGVAGLSRNTAEMLGKTGDREKEFIIAVATNGIRTIERHPLPEKVSNFPKTIFASDLILPRYTNRFGDLGIGV